jgi:hypothetical protein
MERDAERSPQEVTHIIGQALVEWPVRIATLGLVRAGHPRRDA